ncbi:MAG: hypothetical protein CMO66_03830 [Verrucomicrobiales bacterium]|nr:hypothetical protein [Verrucomicrobiales bacterium]
MKICAGTILAVAACLGVSCQMELPRRERVAPDFPAQWRATEVARHAPLEEWWRQFGGDGLNAMVKEALERNHDIQATGQRLEQARLRARIAGAERLPVVNANLEGGRKQSNFIGLPLPGAGGVLSSRSESYRFSLATSWELDLWGRIRAGQIAALADVEVARADAAAARISMAGQVVKTWFLSVEAGQQEEFARRNGKILEAAVNQARLRYELGIRPILDLRQAEASFAANKAVIAQWMAVVEQGRRQLEILIGRYPEGQLGPFAVMPEALGPIPVGLPSDLLTRRPDLRAARLRVLAADARIGSAKGELYPKISLTTSGGTSSDELVNLMNNNFLVWSLGSNLVQPLFSGGRLRANVQLEEARAAEAVLKYRGIVLRAFGEVETALALEPMLRERELQLRQVMGRSSEALALAEQRYARGIEDFVTVLDARRRLNESSSQRLTVLRSMFENRVNLHMALGGGFLGGRE